jgi:hypothetical protein
MRNKTETKANGNAFFKSLSEPIDKEAERIVRTRISHLSFLRCHNLRRTKDKSSFVSDFDLA